MELELYFANDGHAIGGAGNAFVNVLRKPATLEMIRETRRQLQRHFRRWSHGCVSISVLEPSAAQSVPREVRDESAKLTADFVSLAAATVIEGSGFRAAATRTAVTTIFLFSRPAYPHKVFGDLSEGASWVVATAAQTTPLELTAEDMVRAVDKARAAIVAT